MVKASITLPNGTEITIEGAPKEVQSLLDHYGRSDSENALKPAQTKRRTAKKKVSASKSPKPAPKSEGADLAEIVNHVKNCDEAESIETQILDRTGQVDRVLLPLYIVHEYLGNAYGLSSGDIARITGDLGVPVSQPNASKTLSGTASKYVMGDGVRKKGIKLTYKLSRRGVKYMKGVIAGKSDEK